MKSKSTKLTSSESFYYDDAMSNYLNQGYSEKEAEKETVKEMESEFPRLKKFKKWI